MGIMDYLDEEIIYNPMYWLLTAGAEIALMLGFKFQSSWGIETMPLLSSIGVLAAVPVAAYFVVMKITR